MMCILNSLYFTLFFWPYLSTLDEFGMFCYKNPPKLRISLKMACTTIKKLTHFWSFFEILIGGITL